MYKIIDNCITKNKQKMLIHNIVNNHFFPWYFNKDVTYKNGLQNRPSFSHCFVKERKKNSSAANLICFQFSKYIKKQIISCKTIMQLPLKQLNNKYDTPHVDIKIPHTVYLYYLIDSDGETVLFKNKKIHKKIKPKQGRLLIFDGSVLHTAYQPKDNLRCIININVEK